MKKYRLIASSFIVLSISLNAFNLENNKKMCDAGDAKGCYNLGWIYSKGLNVKQDYHKAAKFYSESCYSCS